MTGSPAGTPPEPPGNPLLQLSLEQLRTRTSLKWSAYPADVLPLWVAEMDVTLAAPIAERVCAAVAAGDTGYPAGPHAYAEALRTFAVDRWGWDGVSPDRAALVPDVMMGIVETVKLLTDPGDTVIVCAPVYPPFYAFLTHAGRRVRQARLGRDGRLDMDTIDAAAHTATTSGGRCVLLLSNPHNPTGVVHTREELQQLANLARTYGVRVVSDEIHAPLVLPGAQFVPYLSIPGAEDAFALMSASKGWNLAGLKAALLLAGPDATADLRRLPEEVGHGPSHLGVLAHTAAFQHGGPWLDALISGLDANRTLLATLTAQHLPQVTLLRPESTYLAWLDCRALDLDTERPAGDTPATMGDLDGPAQLFLDHARVAVSSGHAFGAGGAGHVRLNFATHPTILRTAIQRMGAAITTHRAAAAATRQQ